MSVTEPVALAIVGIISGLVSGGFVAVISWLATKRKTAAQAEALEIQNHRRKMMLNEQAESLGYDVPDGLKLKKKGRP